MDTCEVLEDWRVLRDSVLNRAETIEHYLARYWRGEESVWGLLEEEFHRLDLEREQLECFLERPEVQVLIGG